MKQALLFSFFFFILLACNTPDKKKNSGIGGEYKRGSSSVSINDQKGKIDISLCFADETCIEPCLSGLLVNAGTRKYSGWIRSEMEESVSEKYLVVISFYKNELEVLFPQGTEGQFGMSCEPAGVYKK